jgi:hypothetical protein
VPPHLAGIPAVGRYWQSQAIAQPTVVLCIVTMAEQDDLLIRSLASTSQRTGEKFVRCYCVTSLCACVVRRQGAWLQPRSSTISYRSKTVVHALTDPTCSLSASLATTARRPERLPVGGRPPRGDKSLRLRGSDARACPNFCACKMNKGGIPQEWNRHGRSQAVAHQS